MNKQWLSNMIAGAVGAALVLGVFMYFNTSKNQSINTYEERSIPAQQVKLNTAPSIQNPTFDFKEAARIATPAVVHIQAKSKARSGSAFDLFFDGGGQGFSSGSGVIYSTDGYIVTNNHVVEGADELLVTLNDNREFSATVIGQTEKSDLAVIKIEATDLPTLELANSDQVEVGEWVLAVGNPLNLTSTVTAGIVSAKGRSLELLPGRDAIEAFIQTDAAVNPGNSGGALIDAQGRFLGVNTAIATQTGMFQGYSFAIPSNLVVRIVDDIIKYGAYQRAFLGVTIYPLDADAATELGVDFSQGVVIDELVDGGSAQYAGLLPKDIILKVNNKEIKGVPELTEIVGRAKVGDVLDLVVFRKGKTIELPVAMREE